MLNAAGHHNLYICSTGFIEPFFACYNLFSIVQLEQRVNEVEQFYLNTKLKEPNTSRSALMVKDKDKEKHIPSMKKLQQDASRREAVAAKRMQDLMRQFGSIFRQASLLS